MIRIKTGTQILESGVEISTYSLITFKQYAVLLVARQRFIDELNELGVAVEVTDLLSGLTDTLLQAEEV